MDAFLAGLEQAKANGHDLSKIGSVASFFVSRVDTEIDKRLEKIGTRRRRKALRGKAAIANARLAYERYDEGLRQRPLAGAGRRRARTRSGRCGRPPRRRTRTTATCIYVEELVAPGVVNTMPEPMIHAFADHGEVARRHGHRLVRRRPSEVLDRPGRASGIDYDDVVDTLEREGVEKFEASWNELLDGVRSRWTRPRRAPTSRPSAGDAASRPQAERDAA